MAVWNGRLFVGAPGEPGYELAPGAVFVYDALDAEPAVLSPGVDTAFGRRLVEVDDALWIQAEDGVYADSLERVADAPIGWIVDADGDGTADRGGVDVEGGPLTVRYGPDFASESVVSPPTSLGTGLVWMNGPIRVADALWFTVSEQDVGPRGAWVIPLLSPGSTLDFGASAPSAQGGSFFALGDLDGDGLEEVLSSDGALYTAASDGPVVAQTMDRRVLFATHITDSSGFELVMLDEDGVLSGYREPMAGLQLDDADWAWDVGTVGLRGRSVLFWNADADPELELLVSMPTEGKVEVFDRP